MREMNTLYFAGEAVKALKQQLKEYKRANRRVFVLCDTHTQVHCLPVLFECVPDFTENILTIPAGEDHKNIQTATVLWQKLLDKNADKDAVLICLGGGVVCDMGGFVGATFKRGIEYVFFPTTLMAQVDACIGGKTAVNVSGIKNQIGLFRLPTIVFTIPSFLDTLPEKEILSGFAEMLKHGLIADEPYWKELAEINTISQITRPEWIKKSIQIKTIICTSDMHDAGERQKLNFGHTIGHALESFSLSAGCALSHGEAVAFGMMAAADISRQKRLISEVEAASIITVLCRFFSPLYRIERNDFPAILSFLQKDKKKINNKLLFTLLNKTGNAVINQQVNINEIEQSFENIKNFNQINYDTI